MFFIVVIFALSAFYSWDINPASWSAWLRGIDGVIVLGLFVLASFAKGGE
jgi:hypothetical protein